MDLSEAFWDTRYQNNDIGWDLGDVSLPIKSYIDQLEDRSLKILIPGGGNSYEAEYLFKKGFKNIFIADLSKTALDNFKSRVPNFPDENLRHINFFDIAESFDIIIEQTFFCALNPSLRDTYIKKMHSILNPNGKLVGLLFDKPLNKDKPPFGGSKVDYMASFEPFFDLDIFEASYNSMPSRVGSELFMKCVKK